MAWANGASFFCCMMLVASVLNAELPLSLMYVKTTTEFPVVLLVELFFATFSQYKVLQRSTELVSYLL